MTDAAIESLGRVHFMGVGGAGMSGIARIMAMRGMAVSGCDAKESRALVALRALGVEISIGHDPDHLHEVDTLVYSSAIRPATKELGFAHERDIRVLQRAQALAALMQGHHVVAIAGTHGKTTTTSMAAVALQHAGLDPSFAIGGTLGDSGANAHDGVGELFVAEADESDGSFMHYKPHMAVITNIEADHLDHYPDIDAVLAAFKEFAGSVTGTVIGCADDENASALARSVGGVTYGTVAGSDLLLEDIAPTPQGVRFSARWRGDHLGEIQLLVPGRHNALNAGAVLALGLCYGVPAASLIAGLGAFSGTRRRFDIRGEVNGAVVVDDYAHHPTEISATLTAAREMYPGRQLIAVFQPHRYTRTAAFLSEFASALGKADHVILAEVYAAGEDAIPGASGAALARILNADNVDVTFEPSLVDLAALVARTVSGPACILTMGAGDITLIAPEILAALSSRE
jgi:UDP-N-acetylmuramate--alanine ligase